MRAALHSDLVTGDVDLAIARVLEVEPELSVEAVEDLLVSTADRVLGGPRRQGYGVVNAARAAAAARAARPLSRASRSLPPRIDGDHLLFTFRDDGACRVELHGDFDGHMSFVANLARGVDGLFAARLRTPLPGRYRYKFLVDGMRWMSDPSHGLAAMEGLGPVSFVYVTWDIR